MATARLWRSRRKRLGKVLSRRINRNNPPVTRTGVKSADRLISVSNANFRLVGGEDIDVGTEFQVQNIGRKSAAIYKPSDSSGGVSISNSIRGSPDDPGAGGGGVSRHGALTDLLLDDHPQYLTTIRGNVLYYTKTELEGSNEGDMLFWDGTTYVAKSPVIDAQGHVVTEGGQIVWS